MQKLYYIPSHPDSITFYSHTHQTSFSIKLNKNIKINIYIILYVFLILRKKCIIKKFIYYNRQIVNLKVFA